MSYRHNNDLQKILNEYDNCDYEDQMDQREVGENYDIDDFQEGLAHGTNSTFTDYAMSLQIADVPSGLPDLKGLINSKEHPLEIIEQRERDISAKLGNQTGLETQFLVTNYAKKMNKNYRNVIYSVMETISNHCFMDDDNSLPLHSDEYWGTPKCLAVLSQKLIAIGTSHAVALVFDLDESTAKKFGTVKEKNYGPITAMDLTEKDESLVCGYESGHIVLWGITKAQLIKMISPVDKSPILSIKFWKETKNNMIVSNAKGMVHLYKVDHNFFLNWTVEKKPLLDLSGQEKKSTLDPLSHLPDGFFSIQVLKRDLVKDHLLNNHTIIALGSMKMMLIVTLEPNVNIVYRYDRPEGLSDTAIPCLSWGKGALPGQENNTYPILAISWGQGLYLFKCQNVDQEEGKGIKFSGYFHSNAEITHLEWISESNILTYDSNREFKVLFTGLFESANSNKREETAFNYSVAVINTQLVDPDINFQLYDFKSSKTTETHIDKKQQSIKYYTNCITGNILLRSIFILGYKKLYYGTHLDWKEYIEDIATDADWLKALSTFIALSRGTNRMFAGLSHRVNERKEMFREYGADLIRQYIQSVENANRNADSPYCEEIWKTVVLTIIDFLISVENFSYLFTDVKRIFEDYKLQNLFMECLEPFILRNRVKSIPTEPLKEIARYYYEKDKAHVLQYLMFNIDLNDIDPDCAIAICMKYNLLTPLFYLSTHKPDEPDFMTPIARSLSLYQKSLEENSEDLDCGLEFVWFVYITIKGKLFPYGAIPYKVWEENVKDIIALILQENNLDLMLQIQPHVSFEVLRTLFEPKLATLIGSYNQDSICLFANQEKFNKDLKTDESTQVLKYALDRFSASIGNKIQGQMLALIYHCGKKRKPDGQNYQNLVFYMMASLAVHLGYKIPEEVIEECLLYILRNKRDVPRWEIVRKKLDEKNEEEEGNPLTEERSGLIFGLLKRLEGKLGNEELAVIQRITDPTDFVDVKVYLACLRRDYRKCLDLYIGQSTQFQKVKVFNWLDETIYFVKTYHPDQFKELKEIITSYLNSLVSIDIDRSRKIVSSIDATLEANAIKLLEASPLLQLEYLKGLLAHSEKGVIMDDDLLILHIKLLCQLYPKEVMIQVTERAYPSDECLKLCKQYSVHDGVAYFSEQSGNIMDALNILLDLFKRKLEKKLKKIERSKIFNEDSLTIKIHNVKKICWRHSNINDANSTKMWFHVLDKMLEWYLAYIVNNNQVQRTLRNPQILDQNQEYKRFVNTYSEYISDFFDQMTRNVPADNILTKLQDYKELKLGDLRRSLLRMINAYSFDNIIYNNAKDSIVIEAHGNVAQLYDLTAKGTLSEKAFMEIDLTDSMNVYSCGHVLPNIYLQNRHCAICFKSETLRAKKVINSAKKGRRSIIRGSMLETTTTKNSIIETSESFKSFAMNEVGNPNNSKNQKKHEYLKKLAIIEQQTAETIENWGEFEDDQNI